MAAIDLVKDSGGGRERERAGGGFAASAEALCEGFTDADFMALSGRVALK